MSRTAAEVLIDTLEDLDVGVIARNLAESLLEDQPNRERIALALLSDKVRETV